MQTLLLTALLLKLGAAPCHFWFPSTIASISWTNCLILCTWQKLGPLALIIFPFTNTSQIKYITFLVAGINAIIGGLIGINQAHIRTILAYSSITHIGWIIGGFTTNSVLIPILYFTIYSAIITPIFIILNSWKTLAFSQIPQIIINSLPVAVIFSVAILSLGGLPPLTGFIPKWMIIILLRPANWVLVLLLILGRLINLYFYLNLTFNMLTTSLIHNTYSEHQYPKSLRLAVVLGISRLGILPIALYAMTLLY
jgi:NADH-ubiquinone oxidoreductase chain 2